MRSVRCDVCGTKALIAASQCPRCAHLFALRDGFGELLPLSYCESCDSHYPATIASCKWCGTKPAPPPKISQRGWKGIGIAAFAGLLVVGWVLRDAGETPASNVKQTAVQAKDPPLTPVSAPETPATTTSAPVEPVAPRVVATTDSGDVAPRPTPTPAEPAKTWSGIPRDSGATVVDDKPAGKIAEAKVAEAKVAEAKVAEKATAKSKTSARWVNSVAKDWVIVRAAPSRTARLVASLGPNSRVQLGETRGTWRRIRARKIEGWVEPRSSFAALPPPTQARVLVER